METVLDGSVNLNVVLGMLYKHAEGVRSVYPIPTDAIAWLVIQEYTATNVRYINVA